MWLLKRGPSGDGCDLTSILCKYDLFVLSWARVRRVKAGKYLFKSAVWVEVCAVFCYCLLWLDT